MMKGKKHANGSRRGRGGRFHGRRGPSGARPRHIESNGPEGRIAGSVEQVVERYLMLARDARSTGDLVTAENHLQHADHYTRVMLAAAERDQRAPQPAEAADDPEDVPA